METSRCFEGSNASGLQVIIQVLSKFHKLRARDVLFLQILVQILWKTAQDLKKLYFRLNFWDGETFGQLRLRYDHSVSHLCWQYVRKTGLWYVRNQIWRDRFSSSVHESFQKQVAIVLGTLQRTTKKKHERQGKEDISSKLERQEIFKRRIEKWWDTS